MEISEKELEGMIYQAVQTSYGREFLFARGLDVYGKFYRQVRLGKYGVADMISVHSLGRNMEHLSSGDKMIRWVDITVYELKKGPINTDAVLQAFRYISALKRLLKPKTSLPEKRIGYSFNIRLIGDSLDQSTDLIFLLESLNHRVRVYEYNFDFRGIFFDEIELVGWDNKEPDYGDNVACLSRSEIKSILSQPESEPPF
jgi:hypothetical protein